MVKDAIMKERPTKTTFTLRIRQCLPFAGFTNFY